MAIVGVVLAGTTQLFMSAMKSQNEQTNRTQAQQHARLGLDKLRREIRCASALTTPSGYPASSITITLGSYCPTAGGATTVTWCTKPAASGGQPYTLWRYTGPACSGTGTQWASDLVDKVDAPSISAGRIFNTVFLGAATLNSTTAGGTLAAGTYSYVVTPSWPAAKRFQGPLRHGRSRPTRPTRSASAGRRTRERRRTTCTAGTATACAC